MALHAPIIAKIGRKNISRFTFALDFHYLCGLKGNNLDGEKEKLLIINRLSFANSKRISCKWCLLLGLP
jgi:hypothetical protein